MHIKDYATAQGWFRKHAAAPSSVGSWKAFVARNKRAQEPRTMAHGGRSGFEEGLKVENLTPRELTNAQKAARLRNISGKKGNQEFIDFVGGDEYKRFSTLEKEAAENLGMNVDKYKKLSFAKRKKLRTDLFNKKVKESSKFLRPEASVEEVIKTIYTNPKKNI